MMSCVLVERNQSLGAECYSIIRAQKQEFRYPENKGSTFPSNSGKHVSHYTAQLPTIRQSSPDSITGQECHILFSPGATQPIVGVYFTALYRALASSRTRLLDHKQRRATIGRTPLKE